MHLKKGPLIAAAASAILFFATSWPVWAQSADMDFRQLILAAQANIEKIESGRGTARAASVSHAADGRTGKIAYTSLFAFDGDRTRYDQVLDTDQVNAERKFILDGSRFINTGTMPVGRPATTVYIEDYTGHDDMAFGGGHVNPKRTMSFRNREFGDALLLLDLYELAWKGDEPPWTVSVEEDGQYKVVLKAIGITTDETTGEKTATERDAHDVYWFDPEQGFALTRDITVSLGVTSSDTEREYREDDGTWVITSVKFSDRDPFTNRLSGTVTVEYEDFEINVDIPESRFTIADFGLPQSTTVHDKIAGVEYPLASPKTLPGVESLLEEGLSGDEPPDEPVAEAVVHEPEPDVDQSEGEIEKPAPAKGFQLSTRAVMVLLVAVAFCLLAVAIYKGKRRSA